MYHVPVVIFNYRKFLKEVSSMLKFLSKIAEKYAKNTNSACVLWGFLHQPKMPSSLVNKD